MPEAIAILLVGGISLGLFVVLRLSTKRPHGPEEIQRLRERIAWLEDRQRHADEKHWDEGMKAQIAAQLEQARHDLAAHEIPVERKGR